MDTLDYREGDRVRVTAESPDIPAGSAGTIVHIQRAQGRVLWLDVQLDGRDRDTAYITLSPYEIDWV